MKILLVDDEAISRMFFEKFISKISQDIVVVSVANGIKAMEIFDESFDLVITDLLMPGVDGVELIEMVRNKSNVPIIVETGYPAEHLNVDHFLPKPIQPFKLKELIINYYSAASQQD